LPAHKALGLARNGGFSAIGMFSWRCNGEKRMRKLLFLALLIFGGYRAYGYYLQSSVSAFDDNGRPKTLVFTFNGCAPCTNEIELLKQRNIAYAEYNISNNATNQKIMESYGGHHQLPYTVSGSQSIIGYQKEEFIGMLAEAYGSDVLTRYERSLMRHNFDSQGHPVVVMYSTRRCGYCKMAKHYFDEKGVAYVERDIERESSAQQDYRGLKGTGTPLIYVGYQRVSGFDQKRLDKVLASL
jgi:glutaredoxin